MKQHRPTHHDRIITDPNILMGKPVIRGTRIAVEHVLEQLADHPDFQELATTFRLHPRAYEQA